MSIDGFSCLRATILQLYLIVQQLSAASLAVMALETVTESVTAFAEMQWLAAFQKVRSVHRDLQKWNGGHSTDPEYRRREKSAVQCVQ